MEEKNCKLEKAKKKLCNIENTKDRLESPIGKIISSFVDEFPILGVIKTIAETSLNSFQEQKREELCNIIFSDNRITEKMVKDVSFIMEFYKLIEVVDRLSTNTKVEYLGKLFKIRYY